MQNFLSYDLSGGHGGHVHRIAGGQVRARAAGTKSPNCSSSAATATHHHHPCPPGGSSAFYTHTNTHFNTFLKVAFLDWCHHIFIVQEVKRYSLVEVVKSLTLYHHQHSHTPPPPPLLASCSTHTACKVRGAVHKVRK